MSCETGGVYVSFIQLAGGRRTFQLGVVMSSYKTNKQGQTYGRIADSPSPAEEPDLIAASGDGGGISGYIKREDLESSRGPSPATPEEAVVMMEALKANPPGDRVLTLYAEDGETVLGTKTFSPGFFTTGPDAAMPGPIPEGNLSP
jgi:hypothetical protein